MWAFALRRFIHTIPILFGVSLIVFLLVRLMPGDAADILIPPEASPDVRDMLRAAFGLDQPLYIQYALWLQRLAVGDLGVLGRQRPFTHARRVSLDHADHAIHAMRRYTRASASSARRGIR